MLSQYSPVLTPIHSSCIYVLTMAVLPWISTKHGIARCHKISISLCIKTGQGNPVWGVESQKSAKKRETDPFCTVKIFQRGPRYPTVTYMQSANSIPTRLPSWWFSICELPWAQLSGFCEVSCGVLDPTESENSFFPSSAKFPELHLILAVHLHLLLWWQLGLSQLVTRDDQFRLCNLHCEKFSRSHSCRLLEDYLVLGFYVTLKCSPSPLSLSLLSPSLLPTWLFMLLLPSSLTPVTMSSIFSSHGDAVILT